MSGKFSPEADLITPPETLEGLECFDEDSALSNLFPPDTLHTDTSEIPHITIEDVDDYDQMYKFDITKLIEADDFDSFDTSLSGYSTPVTPNQLIQTPVRGSTGNVVNPDVLVLSPVVKQEDCIELDESQFSESHPKEFGNSLTHFEELPSKKVCRTQTESRISESQSCDSFYSKSQLCSQHKKSDFGESNVQSFPKPPKILPKINTPVAVVNPTAPGTMTLVSPHVVVNPVETGLANKVNSCEAGVLNKPFVIVGRGQSLLPKVPELTPSSAYRQNQWYVDATSYQASASATRSADVAKQTEEQPIRLDTTSVLNAYYSKQQEKMFSDFNESHASRREATMRENKRMAVTRFWYHNLREAIPGTSLQTRMPRTEVLMRAQAYIRLLVKTVGERLGEAGQSEARRSVSKVMESKIEVHRGGSTTRISTRPYCTDTSVNDTRSCNKTTTSTE